MEGLKAYKTYLGMVLHFKNSGYDGWLYSFAGKCSPEKFDSQRQLKYQFAAIERNNPDKFDQIRYFYPAFAKHKFVKATDVRTFVRAYKEFDQTFTFYQSELIGVASQTKNIEELVGVYNSLPMLYNAYLRGEASFEFLVLLSLVMPSINKIVADPLVWPQFVDSLKFHGPFYKLYLDKSETTKLETLKQNTVTILSEAWNLKGKM